MNCSKQESGKIGCGMSQVAVYQDTSERLLRVDLRYIPSTQVATIQFIMPLGVSLEFPPQLFIAGKFSAEVPLNYCMPDGCYSTFVVKPEVLEKILAMEKGNIQLQAANGHMMSLPISGNGSREAFNAVSSSATD
ncbi:MAG: invasion associated locus B family protein [Pseudomonadota bacterium]